MPGRDEGSEARHEEDGKGRRTALPFAAMVSSYSLAAFNENFYKQAAMLVAVGIGKEFLQGWATVVFSVPYLLFAAHAGWLADRFSKRRVLLGAKVAELLAMWGGAWGLLTLNWGLILAMAGFMALQSTIFSPSLNGLIPDLYHREKVTWANGVLKIIMMAAILVGVGTAGLALGFRGEGWYGVPWGRLVVTLVAMSVTVLALVVTWWTPSFPASDPKAKFPWKGPWITLKELWRIRREDTLLAIIIGADAWVWFAGALQILVLNKLGVVQYNAGETVTGLLVVTELAGFGVGGMVSYLLARGRRWYRILPPSALAMGVLLSVVAFAPALPKGWQLFVAFLFVCVGGFAGGLFMIPCESFVQSRPPEARKGEVISASNFVSYVGILISGPLGNVLNRHFAPTTSFALIGATGLVAAGVVYLLLHKLVDPTIAQAEG